MTAALPPPPTTKTVAAIRRFLSKITLASGGHARPELGMCLMEAIAYIQDQPFSDHPVCVSPAIGAFGRSWNDNLDDAGRQRLKRFVPDMIGTATTKADEAARAYLAADWLVRTFTPAWLDRAGLTDQAAALRGLPALTSEQLAREGLPIIRAARDQARAKRDAIYKAAWAAGAAGAAWAAGAKKIWDATRGGYYDKRAAVREHARTWARKHFADTIAEMQASAEELLLRMCAVGR